MNIGSITKPHVTTGDVKVCMDSPYVRVYVDHWKKGGGITASHAIAFAEQMLKYQEERSALAERVKVLEAERDEAIQLLAEWCEAIDHNGTGWDDWDEHYKNAAYRPGPLRELLDTAIAAAKEQRANRFA